MLRDQIAKALLENTQKKYSFIQEKKISVLEKPLVTKGTLWIDNKSDVTWNIESPYAIRYIINANQIHEVTANGEHAMSVADNPIAASLGQTLRATLSGDWSVEAAKIDIVATGRVEQWQLRIIPTDLALQKLIKELRVEGSGGIVQIVNIIETSGDLTNIRLAAWSDTH